jgi:hypothetical protein
MTHHQKRLLNHHLERVLSRRSKRAYKRHQKRAMMQALPYETRHCEFAQEHRGRENQNGYTK